MTEQINYPYEYVYITCDPMEMLDDIGVAIIPNIINKKESIKYRNDIWRELPKLTKDFITPITKDNKASWKGIYELYPLHSMLLQHFSIGHLQPIWDIRQHPNVSKVFGNIHETDPEDLLTSFDGMSLHMPPEVTNRGWFRDNNWMHTDQKPNNATKRIIQGFITLYDINEGDATFSFLEGSHKYHEEFFEHFEKSDHKKNWYKLENQEEEDFFTSRGCVRKCIIAKAGDIVLWDSRTIHQGVEPHRNRPVENIRMVIYVCMTPRSWCNPASMKKRIKIFEEKRMTGHIPHRPIMFSKTPRTYGKRLAVVGDIPNPILTILGKRLVGYQ